ncbi:MAG: hypothetical protein NT013_15210 [Planctomycetia bacterium]|nr:hypothetical protein [Planctomycetia bacterium]
MQTLTHFASKHSLRLSVVLFVAVACLHSSGGQQILRGESGHETMPEIAAKLSEWRKSFISARVNWRSWNRQDFVEANPGVDPDKALGITDYAEDEFLWADWGGYREEMKIIKGDKLVYKWATGSDATQNWDATTKYSGNQDVLDLIKLGRPESNRPLASISSYVGISGLWNSPSGRWIDETLPREPYEIVSHAEDIDGHQCVLIQLVKPDSESRFWLVPRPRIDPP